MRLPPDVSCLPARRATKLAERDLVMSARATNYAEGKEQTKQPAHLARLGRGVGLRIQSLRLHLRMLAFRTTACIPAPLCIHRAIPAGWHTRQLVDSQNDRRHRIDMFSCKLKETWSAG